MLFPPFYSLLLAAIGSFGVDVLEAGRWVNAVAFGLTILAAGLWLRRSLESSVAGWLALGAVVVLVTSLPLNDAASRILTESVFVLFVLLALIQLSSFRETEGHSSLLWAAAFSALAALTRYAGVALILTGVLLLLACRGAPFADRLRRAGLFCAAALIPLAVVLVRNWTVSGFLTGPRVGTGQSLADSLSQVTRVLGGWVVPANAPDWTAYLLWPAAGLLVLVLLVGVLAVVASAAPKARCPVRLRVFVGGQVVGGDGAAGRCDRYSVWAALPFVVFGLVYLVFIVSVVPSTVPYPIGNRFLVPLYVPTLLAATLLLDRLLLTIEAEGRMEGRIPVVIVMVGALIHVGVSARINLGSTSQALESGYVGRTYNTSYWRESDTLAYLRANRIDGGTYSNNAFVVWLADMTASPGTHDRLLVLARGTSLLGLKRGIEKIDAETSTIVWFRFRDLQADRMDYDDVDIRSLPGVETVADLSDGVIFRVASGQHSTTTD